MFGHSKSFQSVLEYKFVQFERTSLYFIYLFSSIISQEFFDRDDGCCNNRLFFVVPVIVCRMKSPQMNYFHTNIVKQFLHLICFRLTLFNIVAEFHESRFGTLLLSHDGFNYGKHFYSPRKDITTWRCTRVTVDKCTAKTVTKEVNGITMMKSTTPKHNHGAKQCDKGDKVTEIESGFNFQLIYRNQHPHTFILLQMQSSISYVNLPHCLVKPFYIIMVSVTSTIVH